MKYGAHLTRLEFNYIEKNTTKVEQVIVPSDMKEYHPITEFLKRIQQSLGNIRVREVASASRTWNKLVNRYTTQLFRETRLK